MCNRPHTLIDERNQLVPILLKPMDNDNFALIISLMTTLCERYEGSTKHRTTATSPASVDSQMVKTVSVVAQEQRKEPRATIKLQISPKSPNEHSTLASTKDMTRLTCLFCFGNSSRATSKPFSRSDGLRKHYRKVHFSHMVGPIVCPTKSCQFIIQSPGKFFGHAASIHKSCLGVRARVDDRYENPRPVVLMPFSLALR